MESCKTCVYWKKKFHGYVLVEFNSCRRNAPFVDAEGWTSFPNTYADDWCGEYKKGED